MAKHTRLLICIFSLSFIISCKHKAYVLPVEQRTGDPSVCFERDILPIFISECAKSGCHDAITREKGYVLDNYDNIVKKGIVPGNPLASEVYLSLQDYAGERMPEDAPPLSTDQISLIEKWIKGGAIKDSACYTPCDSNLYSYTVAIQPLVQKYCYGCHSGAAPQGNLSLVSYNDVKQAVLTRNLVKCIRYEPGYPSMPQAGLRLTTCQVRQFEKWVDDGMPR